MGIRNLSTASISTGTKRSKFWDQSAVINNSSLESIQTITVNSATPSATIDFTSIPQTYKHLHIRGIGRDNRAADANTVKLNFNGDTGANYNYHLFGSDGTNPPASINSINNTAGVATDNISVNGAGTNMGMMIAYINDYTANKFKSFSMSGGYVYNSSATPSGEVVLWTNSWANTSAINRITLTPNGGGSFTQYSHFALYGVKG